MKPSKDSGLPWNHLWFFHQPHICWPGFWVEKMDVCRPSCPNASTPSRSPGGAQTTATCLVKTPHQRGYSIKVLIDLSRRNSFHSNGLSAPICTKPKYKKKATKPFKKNRHNTFIKIERYKSNPTLALPAHTLPASWNFLSRGSSARRAKVRARFW